MFLSVDEREISDLQIKTLKTISEEKNVLKEVQTSDSNFKIGEKSFKCDTCERKFVAKGNLERHIINVHKG